MTDKSPLFISANELLAHSIELYTQGNERKYKFVILHLANAIELILKDRVIDLGISIYREQKKHETIGIWEAFTELEKASIKVPERPIIELLIDDRNTIQHRFGFPDPGAVFYYIDHVLKFFCRFLREEYDLELVEILQLYIKDEALEIFGLLEEDSEFTPLKKLFSISPEAAIIQAYNLIEKKLMEGLSIDTKIFRRTPLLWSYPVFIQFLKELADQNFITRESADNFNKLREMRNRAAHSAHFHDEINIEKWQVVFDIGENLISGINKAIKQGFFTSHRTELKTAIIEGGKHFSSIPSTEV